MLIFPFYWSACKDLSPSCPSWAEQGECGKNPTYMLDNCCRSCRKWKLTFILYIFICVRNMPSFSKKPNSLTLMVHVSFTIIYLPIYFIPNGVYQAKITYSQRNIWIESCLCWLSLNILTSISYHSLFRFLTGCKNWVKDGDCSTWASAGYCNSNPSYMLINCKESCAVC